MLKRHNYKFCTKCRDEEVAIKIGRRFYCSDCYYNKFGREVKENEYPGHLAGKSISWYPCCKLCLNKDTYGTITRDLEKSYLCFKCWEFLDFYC